MNKCNKNQIKIKIIDLIFILIFFGTLLLLAVGNILFGKEQNISYLEKRYLQQKPNFTYADYFSGKYTRQLDKYLDDQFFLRGRFLSLKSRLSTFKGIGRIYPLSVKTNNYSDLNQLIFNFNFANDFCFVDYTRNQQNEEIYVDIIKNFAKNNPDLNIFPMLIPSAAAYIPKEFENLTDDPKETIEFVSQKFQKISNISFIDVRPEFAKLKLNEIYFNTDHHWNGDGAYAGYLAACTTLSLEPTSKSELKKSEVQNFFGTNYANTMDKKMSKMPDTIITYSPKYPIVYRRFSYDETYNLNEWEPVNTCVDKSLMGPIPSYAIYLGGDTALSIIKTQNSPNANKIIIVKDSFANPLSTILCNNYSEIHLLDYRHFKGKIAEYARISEIQDIIIECGVNSILYESTLDYLTNLADCKEVENAVF